MFYASVALYAARCAHNVRVMRHINQTARTTPARVQAALAGQTASYGRHWAQSNLIGGWYYISTPPLPTRARLAPMIDISWSSLHNHTGRRYSGPFACFWQEGLSRAAFLNRTITTLRIAP